MEYSIKKLAQISGVTTRTLRYYDEIGLLTPLRVASNGYRIYGPYEVQRLQQILFYREMDFSLDEIKNLLENPDFNQEEALMNHLFKLQEKQERLKLLIDNVTKSISALKGEIIMSDVEKFEGFKDKLIKENEEKYGGEARAKYGNQAVEKSNKHLKGITQEQYDKGEKLRLELETTLGEAFVIGNPHSALAQKACDLHRQWLEVFYPGYSKDYHKGLADMYVADERFKANYEKIADGCTEFLRESIYIYCQDN